MSFLIKKMLQKVCFFIPLRRGCIIICTIGILVGTISLILGVHGFGGIIWPNIIAAILYIVAYGCTLIGSIAYSKTIVSFGLILSATLLVLQSLFGVYIWPQMYGASAIIEYCQHINGCAEHDALNMIVRIVSGFFLSVGMNIYFWYCNYSFYNCLKSGEFKLLVEEDFN